MSTVMCALIAVLFLFGVLSRMLTVLRAGHPFQLTAAANVRGQPRTRAESASRRLLVGVRNTRPGHQRDGRRTDAAHHAASRRETLPLRRTSRQRTKKCPKCEARARYRRKTHYKKAAQRRARPFQPNRNQRKDMPS